LEGKKEGIGLETRKMGLIERAKRLDRAIYGRECEMKALETVLGGKKQPPPPGRIRVDIDKIEFRIATEAYTVKHERDLLKKIKEKVAHLAESVAFARKRGRTRRLSEHLASMRKERLELEEEIQKVKKELVRARRKGEQEHFKKQRRKKTEYVREERRKEAEKYKKPVESLEIGDIAIMRKKKEGEAVEND